MTVTTTMMNGIQKLMIMAVGVAGAWFYRMQEHPIPFLMVAAIGGLVLYMTGAWLQGNNRKATIAGESLDSFEKIAPVLLQLIGILMLIAVAVLLYLVGGYDAFFGIFRG